jgi:sulfur carrier protein
LGSFRSAIELHPRANIDVTESIEYFEVIALKINGESRSFAAPMNVAALIEQLELRGKRIALERNGEIVPRSQFDAMELSDGDALEIVVAVGGG